MRTVFEDYLIGAVYACAVGVTIAWVGVLRADGPNWLGLCIVAFGWASVIAVTVKEREERRKTVHRVTVRYVEEGGHYVALCECGWFGPTSQIRGEATAAGRRHGPIARTDDPD